MIVGVWPGLLLGFAAVASAIDAKAPADSDVIHLDASNFESSIASNRLVMVEFYAPWCIHSQHLAGRYVSAAASLKDEDVILAQVDCVNNSELCDKYGIETYPNIKLFKEYNVTNPIEYNGHTDMNGLVQFVDKYIFRAVQVISSKEKLDEIIKSTTKPVVVDNGVPSLNETFYRVAEQHADEFNFVSFPNDQEDSVSVFVVKDIPPTEDDLEPKKEIKHVRYQGEKNKLVDTNNFLINWVKLQTSPPFVALDEDNINFYLDLNQPIGYYIYENEDDLLQVTDFFINLGTKNSNKISFANIDAHKFSKQIEALHFDQKFPTFVIHNVNNNLKYVPAEMTNEAIEQLVQDYLAGVAKPVLKSEEEPVQQDSDVYKLVGKTHDAIVADESKDVLVNYYAPWSDVCQQVAPLYHRVGSILSADPFAKDKIIVAEIDAMANDIPNMPIESYPTCILYPAGKDAKPVTFTGNRSIENFMNFIEENSNNKIPAKQLFNAYRAQVAKEAELAAQSQEEAKSAEAQSSEAHSHDEL